MKKAYVAAALGALSLQLVPMVAGAQANSSSETTSRQPVLTKPPVLIHFEEAPYPESEKESQKPASVVLQIAINDKGIVEYAGVVQSAGPAFDAAAVEAVKKFVFEPAEVDNKPAPVKVTYRYDFIFKEEPKSPVLNFDGDIRNRFTKEPMPGVTVEIAGVGKAVTDENGHFSFNEVPEGTVTITITGPELTGPVTTEELIEKGKKTSVKYSLEPKEEVPEGEEAEAADMEIVVMAPKIRKEVVSTEISAEEGRRVPGTAGDTLKVVQNLPGVARASFGSGQLVVWGASPQDTRVYIDGVRVPQLYHGGGLRSVFTSDLVRAIALAPGGYGSAYGRGLGGLVTVDSRALRGDKFHGFVAADIIDASAMVEAPVSATTRVAVAARKSYLSSVLTAVSNKDVNDFIPIPDYYDGQVKVTHDIGKNEAVEFMGLISHDHLTRTLDNPDPAQIKKDDSDTTFGRISARYTKQLDDGSQIMVTPWGGQDHFLTSTSFGGTPNTLDNTATVFGLRAAWRGQTSTNTITTVGLDFDTSFNSLKREGSVTLPAREGDITVFGQAPPEQINADTWHTVIASVAPYGELDFSMLEDKLHIIPGVRIEPFITSVDRKTPVVGDTPAIGVTTQTTAIDPRLAINYQVLPRMSVKAAFGMYHQSPQASDLSPVFGNPNANISRAMHFLTGFNFKFTEKLSLEQVVFFSKSDDLLTRSLSSTPALAELLVQEGQGRAYGTQVLLRHELTKGFFGWISYTLMRSERLDHPNTEWRLFDYDQTHVATLVASYDLGAGFEIGARLRYATGFPRTPVVDSYRSVRRDIYEPIFGAHNTIRIPAFMQADVRLSKRFTPSWGKLEFYLDVQNVTNRSNPEEIAYNFDYTQKNYITGLPILPVFGGRAEW